VFNGGCSALPAYRLYRLDGAGKITSADWIAAESDGEALQYLHDRVDGARYELWERKRLISRFGHKE
jgi:hypothetical protein